LSKDYDPSNPDWKRLIYIYVFQILFPLLFSIIPAFLILALNATLWCFMRHYTNLTQQIRRPSTMKSDSYSTSISKNRVTQVQKSYYLTIIMIGIYLILTVIPYYSMMTYYWATQDKDYSRLHSTIQSITSVFFNSNHCINIVFYLLFHKEFRHHAFLILRKVSWQENKHDILNILYILLIILYI
jgi:hypothetical protein